MGRRTELSSFNAFAVLDGDEVIAVTDTFLSAIEATEMRANELVKDIDNSTESRMAILAEAADESNVAVDEKPGFYGVWQEFDEKEGFAELEVFQVRKKRDGWILAGSVKRKDVASICVQPTTVDLFNGYLVPFTTDADADALSDVDAAAVASDDDDDDDRTYCDGEDSQ